MEWQELLSWALGFHLAVAFVWCGALDFDRTGLTDGEYKAYLVVICAWEYVLLSAISQGACALWRMAVRDQVP